MKEKFLTVDTRPRDLFWFLHTLVEVVEQGLAITKVSTMWKRWRLFNKMNETICVEAVECVHWNEYLVPGGSDGMGDVYT